MEVLERRTAARENGMHLRRNVPGVEHPLAGTVGYIDQVRKTPVFLECAIRHDDLRRLMDEVFVCVEDAARAEVRHTKHAQQNLGADVRLKRSQSLVDALGSVVRPFVATVPYVPFYDVACISQHDVTAVVSGHSRSCVPPGH